MKTIKIIDLLNKIAKGEEVPKKIKYMDTIYTFDECYKDNWKYSVNRNGTIIGLLENNLYYNLNDEVKIIEEEKEIKKINKNRYIGTDLSVTDDILDKLDELIDAVNELKGKSD